MAWISMHSPVGDLTLHAEGDTLISLDWGWAPDCPDPIPDVLYTAQDQLNEYFDGVRTAFDLPLQPEGTPFQQRVWRAMAQIPYGTVQSYGDIAKAISSAPRAIGHACGANPLPILLPCHRVLAASKKLTGYSGGDGIQTKADLLRLEGFDDFRAPA